MCLPEIWARRFDAVSHGCISSFSRPHSASVRLLIDPPHPTLADRDPMLDLDPVHVLRTDLGIGRAAPPRLTPQLAEREGHKPRGEASQAGTEAVGEGLKST